MNRFITHLSTYFFDWNNVNIFIQNIYYTTNLRFNKILEKAFLFILYIHIMPDTLFLEKYRGWIIFFSQNRVYYQAKSVAPVSKRVIYNKQRWVKLYIVHDPVQELLASHVQRMQYGHHGSNKRRTKWMQQQSETWATALSDIA